MSVISLLSGDFEILFEDETDGGNGAVGLKMIRRASGASSTIYTTRQLYSAVAENTDEFIAMGFENPMLPTTPNAYTMENQYFIPRSSTEFLKEGAITSTDWGSNEICYIAYTVGMGADFVAGDIGHQVTGGTTTDTGTLLDFETLPDGTKIAWIRPDDPATDLFDDASENITTGGGGTGDVTTTAVSVSGESQYASIQAIGSVPTATEVYLIQDRIKMTDSTGAFQWWTTDPTVSLGIIDILIRTQLGGTNVADGDVEVFARRYTSLYDNFRLNVAAGGRSALPLASAPDINNTTGYARVTTDAWDTAWTPVVGDVFQLQGDSAQKGVVTAVSGTGPNFTIDFYHTGNLVAFADNDIIEDVPQTGDVTLSSNETATPDGPTETGAGNGATVTISLGGFLVDHNGDSTNEPYSVEVDAQGDVPKATVYEVLKYRTRRGADETDLFSGAGANIPGETYRGLDGLFEYDANTGAMTEGDDVTSGTWSARLLHQNSTNSPTYVTVTDQQTSLESIADDEVIADEAGGDNVTVHAGGTLGLVTFTSPKASPLGTFTGSDIFGARGVVFINPGSGDAQSYILTDDLGNLNNPPNTQTVEVSNTTAGDRVLVADDDGTAGVIDKDRFGGSHATNNAISSTTFEVGTSIDTDVAAAGYIRVVATTEQQEHRYRYASRTSTVFTLVVPTGSTGTTTGGNSTTNLVDSGGGFQGAEPVVVGDLIRNTTSGDIWEVSLVNSDTDLSVILLYQTGDGSWDTSDGYEINELIQAYDGSDNVYAPIIDAQATTTSISNTIVVGSGFGIVANVRKGKSILPFTQNTTVNTGATTTVTTVRTPDTIAV